MEPLAPLPFVPYQQPEAGFGGLALVGEAPGAEEARIGRPFVGLSGRLLDDALAAAGIDRRRCLVANVFRRQPPGNKVGHFFASRGRARKAGLGIAERFGRFGTADWCLDAFAAEIDHLHQVLADLRPAVIVALGRTPLWALTGRNGILALRGQVLDCPPVPGARVVPSLHPSYILRGQRQLLPLLHGDLRLAAGLCGNENREQDHGAPSPDPGPQSV